MQDHTKPKNLDSAHLRFCVDVLRRAGTGVVRHRRLLQEAGHIRAFAAFTALTTACVMGHALAVNPASWALLLLVAGVAVTDNHMVVESGLNAYLNGLGSPQQGDGDLHAVSYTHLTLPTN